MSSWWWRASILGGASNPNASWWRSEAQTTIKKVDFKQWCACTENILYIYKYKLRKSNNNNNNNNNNQDNHKIHCNNNNNFHLQRCLPNTKHMASPRCRRRRPHQHVEQPQLDLIAGQGHPVDGRHLANSPVEVGSLSNYFTRVLGL